MGGPVAAFPPPFTRGLLGRTWTSCGSWGLGQWSPERESIARTAPKCFLDPLGTAPTGILMKVKLHEVECDEDELLEIPEAWIPVRLEHNGYATPRRKAFTLYYLEKA